MADNQAKGYIENGGNVFARTQTVVNVNQLHLSELNNGPQKRYPNPNLSTGECGLI